MTGVPIIPVVLRIDSWKRHKDIITGVFKGETGIGQALRNIKLAYEAVQWQYFDPHVGGPLPKPRTLEALEARYDDIKDKKGQLTNLKGKIATARGLCQSFGDKWERSAVVPKATRVHVQTTMTDACDDFVVALDNIGDDGYDIVRQEIIRVNKMAAELLTGWVNKVRAAIPQVKEDPTVDNYHELLHDHMRGLGTSLSKISKYKDFYDDTWNEMTEDSFMAGVKDGKPVGAKLAQVEAALKQLKTAMKT